MTESKTSLKNFEELLLAGDINSVEKFLSGLTTAQRTSIAPIALKIFKKTCKGKVSFTQNKVSWEFPLGLGVTHCAVLAAICTAEPEALMELNWSTIPDEYFEQPLYQKLRPSGIAALGEILLSKNLNKISIVRRLYKDGLIAKPVSEKYILGLYALRQNQYSTFAEFLLNNQDILEEDLWQFFKIEGNGENSLAASDKYSSPNQKWEDALVQLSQDCHIDRQRLLTESLEALSRGFMQFRAAWYGSLHESLNPTAEERKDRLELYGDLLANPLAPTVSLAIKAIEIVDHNYSLNADFIEKYLPLVITSTTKAVLTSALGILERAVKRNRSLAPAAGKVLCQGLYHPAPDIQNKVLSFIKKYLDASQISALQLDSYSESLAPSARAELKDLCYAVSSPASIAPHSQACQTYSAVADRYLDWPLLTTAKLEPIKNVSDLIASASFCLENNDEVEEIERVLDAVSSIDTRETKDFDLISKPLVKRARTLLDKKSYKGDCHALYAAFVLSWLTKDPSCLLALNHQVKDGGTKSKGDSNSLDPLEQVIWARMISILERVKRDIYAPLLSCPTNKGGWLSPDAFLSRCRIWHERKLSIDQSDLVFCLMRLPEASRSEVAKADVCPISLRAALETLLKASSEETERSNAKHLVNSSKIKESILSGDLLARMAKEAQFTLPQRKIWRDEMFTISWLLNRTRWQALMFPAMRDSFFDRGVSLAQAQIGYSDSSVRALKGYFEVLCEPHAPLSKRSNTLITTGLFLADPEITSLTIDALALAIDEKRLDIKQLGDEVIPFLHGEISKQARFAKTLKEVARISPIHQNAVIQLIEYSLHPQDYGCKVEFWSVLELLHELMIDSSLKLTDPVTIKYLESLASLKTGTEIDSGKSNKKGKTKTSTLAAKLLAL